MNSILKINDSYATDESIANYQTYSFYPITGTQLNNPGSITITVQNSDNFYHIANSWLEFEGELVKSSNHKAYPKDTLITFANNGILHLFDNIKYLLSSTEIESIYNPGTTTNIIGLAKHSSSFSPGLIQCWAPDTSDEPAVTNTGFKQRHTFLHSATPVGKFRFAVPLNHILGFAEDYTKVLYGFVHTLVLTRSSSNANALFRRKDTTPETNNVEDGYVNLEQVRWMIPRVSPADVARYELFKQIKAAAILNVGFRMRQSISTSVSNASNQFTWRLGIRSSPEQPRYIFLAFQTDRVENQEKNIATFDHCNLASAHVELNNDRYPMNSFETDFTMNHYDHLYHDFASFVQKFYKIDKMVACTSVDPLTYKSLYPIFFFDVSRQSERLKSGVTDITLHCQFKENPAVKTIAHAVMISDRKLRFKSDGEKMTVLF